MSNKLNIWIENSPKAPPIEVYDYVLIHDGKRRLSGFVEEKGPGWMRMYCGPTFPISAVIKFVQRNGVPFVRGTQALPANHF